jgi:diguanylate cyclase (GGDEF)-like protein
MQMRRLQHDVARADSGIDPASSLRNKKAMVVELERELERRARRGRPFSLAMASIDNFEVLRNHATEAQLKHIFATVGRLIHKCIRSFDDGYRSGESEFVMSLKHADSAGGTTAINRLRSYLDQEKLTVPDGQGNMAPLTMSYCVAEPVPGDTLDELMKNMRQDLERYREGGNTALQYYEQSPLTRLIRGIEK